MTVQEVRYCTACTAKVPSGYISGCCAAAVRVLTVNTAGVVLTSTIAQPGTVWAWGAGSYPPVPEQPPRITWRDKNWIEAGARVRLTERAPGVVISSHPALVPPGAEAPLLVGGARGVVTVAPHGGHPEEPCPDHHLGEDYCLCSSDTGVLPERLPVATVEWELSDGQVLRQLLRYPGTGGRAWERVDDDAWVPTAKPNHPEI